MFKIKFPTSDLIWDFIERLNLSNYTATNSTAIPELDEKYHNKDKKVYQAEEFQGEEIL